MIRLVAILAVTLMAVVGALALLPLLLTPDRIARLAVDRIEQALAVEVTAIGEAELSLVPRPRLRIDGIQAQGTLGSAAVDLADLHLSLPALLGGKLVLDRASLAGLRAEVAHDATLSAIAASLTAPALAHAVVDIEVGTLALSALGVVEVDRARSAPEGANRQLTFHGRWAARDVVADLLFGGLNEPRLEHADIAFGADRLRFDGRLSASTAFGRIDIATADAVRLREALPAPPLPPLGDALLAEVSGAVALAGHLRTTKTGWRLERLDVTTVGGRATGTLSVDDGRLAADLQLDGQVAPASLAEPVFAMIRNAPDLVRDIAAIEVDGRGLSLSLRRDADGLVAAVRLSLAGDTDVVADGRIDLEHVRFDGPLTLVSADLGRLIPASTGLALPAPWPVTLAADVVAAPSDVTLTAVRFTAPEIVFRGDVGYAPDARPALIVDGIVDRARLPADLGSDAGRRAALAALWRAADRGGARVDLDIRRLELAGNRSGAGRLIGQLEPDGLWLTALELRSRDLGLSLTGGLHRDGSRIDALGAAEITNPGAVLRHAWRPLGPARLRLPAGRLALTLEGPLDTVAVGLTGDFRDLSLDVVGTADLLAGAWRRGQLDLRHPDAGALLAALGARSSAAGRLEGPVEVAALLEPSGARPHWRGRARVGELVGEGLVQPSPLRIDVARLDGPVAHLDALGQVIGLWPDGLERWRDRRQGDWPDVGPLATVWPPPFELRVRQSSLLDAGGERVELQLGMVAGDDRIDVGEAIWRSAQQMYVADATILRGNRGLDITAALTFRDRLDSAVPRALGLGWLGVGTVEGTATLATRGAIPADLAANVEGVANVSADVRERPLRLRSGQRLGLPELRIAGPVTIDRGRVDLDGLAGEGITIDGVAELFLGQVAATLTLAPADGGEPIRLDAIGDLAAPLWLSGATLAP